MATRRSPFRTIAARRGVIERHRRAVRRRATAFPRVAGDAESCSGGVPRDQLHGSAGAFGDDPSWPGVWYLYISTTYDGGKTWTTVNATPNDPVQRGTICGGGPGCTTARATCSTSTASDVDKQGRVLRRRTPTVASTPASLRARTGSPQGDDRPPGERQPRLFAAFDKTAVAGRSRSSEEHGGTPPANMLSWQAPDDHGSAITGYKIYRNGSLLATVAGDQRATPTPPQRAERRTSSRPSTPPGKDREARA